MSMKMDDEIKWRTAKRKGALARDIIQEKTTMAEVSRAFELSPSEVESWADDGNRGMENALRAAPLDFIEQCERQVKVLQEAYGKRCGVRTRMFETIRLGLQVDGIIDARTKD